ncbi:MAG: ABC transporter permease [Chloroflexota bacterium]
MKAFAQLYVASLKEFTRERMTIFWTLAFPVMFILLFGLIFSGGGNSKFDVGFVVEDNGSGAAQLTQVFQNVSVFKLNEGARDKELAALKKGDVRAVIILPAGLSQAIAQKQASTITVYYDPANQQTSQIVLGITQQVLQETDRRISGAPTLLKIDEQTIQAQGQRFIDFFVPGMLALALMQLGLFGTAQPIVQLREQGVLRRLGATPLPRLTILASQIAMRLTIAFAQTAAIVLISRVVFNVPMLGNWLVLIGFVALGGLMFVSLGYVIAAFSKNQESAAGISSLLNFPMMFLSGLFFPIEVMPDFLKPVVQIVPLTYLADALRQEMVAANAIHPLMLDAGVLVVWLVGSAVVAVKFFKWE